MQTFQADLAIVGAGGAGLRAAIAAAQANPNAKNRTNLKSIPDA
ncbi:fumarate reductase flavoprotein subunit [Escherichia coli]|nr:fumarate reductase flavoprotein subunit [Escherichia coli]